MVDVIHIHEDDCGMRNLYPIAAFDEAASEVAAAAAAAERNRDPSGFGFTAMHMVELPSITYVDVGLRLDAAAAALAPIMPRAKRFAATIFHAMLTGETDPYGSYEEGSWAFGLGPHCYIKLEPKGELVEAVWFGLDSDDPAHADALRRSMLAIDALAPSIVADFFLDQSGPVGDPAFLDSYFEAYRDNRIAADHALEAYRAAIPLPQPPGLLRKLANLFGGRGR